jgi:hypothetical protein
VFLKLGHLIVWLAGEALPKFGLEYGGTWFGLSVRAIKHFANGPKASSMTSVRKTYRRLVSRAAAQSANPQKVPLDHPNFRRVGRRRSQQCDAKKVRADVCRLPSLKLQRSDSWRKW